MVRPREARGADALCAQMPLLFDISRAVNAKAWLEKALGHLDVAIEGGGGGEQGGAIEQFGLWSDAVGRSIEALSELNSVRG